MTATTRQSRAQREEQRADEYHVTLQALAVVVEWLLQTTKGDVIAISPEVLANSPDLISWRDPESGVIGIKVSR